MSVSLLRRIVITPGEPAGIGPDIILQLMQQNFFAKLPAEIEIIIIADPDLMLARAQALGISLNCITSDINHRQMALPQPPGTLKIFPVTLKDEVEPGKLNTANVNYVLQTLDLAATLCEQKNATALVTGPIHKGIINQGNIPFSGHTEYFAKHSHITDTVMLFVVEKLKVALLTTHLPLSQVARAITSERLQAACTILNHGLKKHFGIDKPRISVCGLNPHAGESGYLGREEIDIIQPAIEKLRQHMHIQGPLSADTLFTPQHLTQADAVLAMYHDQALPVVKYIGFGQTVNVTLGLPYVRTSVDHGTALELAGTGLADPGSMMAAIRLAIDLIWNKKI